MFQYLRILFLVIIDIVLVNFALFSSLIIRFEGEIPSEYYQGFFDCYIPFTAVLIVSFFLFGLYRRTLKYASIGELLVVVGAVSCAVFVNTVGSYFINGQDFPLPRSIFILHWLLTIALVGASRLVWRLMRDYGIKMNRSGGLEAKRVLVVGAGDAGVLVIKELKAHYNGSINIVGFIDDDLNKQKMIVQGIAVLGVRNDIPELVNKHEVEEIIIAMPSAGGRVIRETVSLCRDTKAKVKILPGVYDIIDGKVQVSKIRDVQVEDLLGREPVKVDLDKITGYIKGKVVLITGGGGSIGSELCRQVADYAPQKLLIMDSCENNVYDIDMELRESFPALKVVPLVKDVRDRKAVTSVFRTYRPVVIFHAAAHKHVPLMEYNPEDAIKNNVMGTYNVAQAADMFRAKKFVLISTDKAVNPTSFMGASKRLAEMVVQHLDKISSTSYVAVRFGNVLGSRGSVIPLFKKQIARGGPVTVTHPDMVRYFMTIPEAVQLVIQAGAMAKGGEIFVLDMGEPVQIMELAENIIRLSGYEPYQDINIKITGIRPGEKLYEELLTAEEGVTATTHRRIFVAKPNGIKAELIEEKIIGRIITDSLPQNEHDAKLMIQEFLPEFKQIEQQSLTYVLESFH
ncbi:MAG: nucleoside-diphosphate sugar epimerase/dehydratase [Desulfitobacteriaceae bacterium]|nr:nucleoside-diphosphate sugar epimerase/dehydratase [Desulfitobacteriaceae bacterium]